MNLKGCNLVDVLCLHFPGRTEENYKNSVRIVCVSADFQSNLVPHTSSDRSRYTNLLNEKLSSLINIIGLGGGVYFAFLTRYFTESVFLLRQG
jgi:hypothetical protein